MQNLHADGLYHEPASKCNFDLNRQNTLLLNLFGTIGRKNTTLDGMYHMLLVTVWAAQWWVAVGHGGRCLLLVGGVYW